MRLAAGGTYIIPFDLYSQEQKGTKRRKWKGREMEKERERVHGKGEGMAVPYP